MSNHLALCSSPERIYRLLTRQNQRCEIGCLLLRWSHMHKTNIANHNTFRKYTHACTTGHIHMNISIKMTALLESLISYESSQYLRSYLQ